MKRKRKSLAASIPLNFLLGCSDRSLGNLELARLGEVADLRKELHSILDRLIDQMAQAALAAWFRTTDRDALKQALENPDDVIALAKEQILLGQRDDEELVPLTSLPPGAAHLAAALRYQERNIAQGLCALCPEPLAHNSVRFCEKHLAAARLRIKPKNAKGSPPGSIGWLHGEGFESQHGRQPGTLQSLAIARKKKSRAVLAELGLPLESAATALEGAKAALLGHAPRSGKDALMAWELFDKASISDSLESTGKHALQELVAAGLMQRVGKGIKGDSFRYFTRKAFSVFGRSTDTLVG